MIEKSAGLLLQAIPYLGQQKILKVFTAGSGMLSILSKRVKNSAVVSPFCIAEWVYKKGSREIHSLVDASLSDGLLDLRSRYEAVSTAGQIAQDLVRTQLPGKPSPDLFALSCAVFQKIASFQHPEVLTALFRLKLLIHEGLLSLEPTCTACSEPALCLFQGESYCLRHGQSPFQVEEWDHLLLLARARSFSALQRIPPIKGLYPKIGAIFEERIRH